MKREFDDFRNQKLNKQYLYLITVSNSTFRAFHKGSAYRKGQPSKVFRSWMFVFLDNLNKYKDNKFDLIFKNAKEDLKKHWKKETGICLIEKKKEYLLLKLLDLFFKHAALYNSLNSKVAGEILKNTMPPLDSKTLEAISGKKGYMRILKTKDENLLNAIPSSPSMGNAFKKTYYNSYEDFRVACHQNFKVWAKENNTSPICFDLLAWNGNSDALSIDEN